jgi:hypothetical protein
MEALLDLDLGLHWDWIWGLAIDSNTFTIWEVEEIMIWMHLWGGVDAFGDLGLVPVYLERISLDYFLWMDTSVDSDVFLDLHGDGIRGIGTPMFAGLEMPRWRCPHVGKIIACNMYNFIIMVITAAIWGHRRHRALRKPSTIKIKVFSCKALISWWSGPGGYASGGHPSMPSLHVH